MGSIIYEYLIIKIVLILILITTFILFKIKKIPKLIMMLIEIIFLVGLLWQFNGPSLKSNFNVYRKLNNISSVDVESINVLKKKTTLLKNTKDFERIINSLRMNRFGLINGPDYDSEYKLIINLKDKTEINIKILRLTSGEYRIKLMNNYKGKQYEIGSYQNKKLNFIIDNAIKK